MTLGLAQDGVGLSHLRTLLRKSISWACARSITTTGPLNLKCESKLLLG